MSRHDRDAVSLMGGLLLVLLAGAYLVGDLTSFEVDGRWVAPLVLLAVGAAGVVSTLRPRSGADDHAAAGDHAAADGAPTWEP